MYTAAMSDEKGRVFPTLKPQDKADRTTQVVREIAERDRRASVANTARLKALRMARDAEAGPPPTAESKPKR